MARHSVASSPPLSLGLLVGLIFCSPVVFYFLAINLVGRGNGEWVALESLTLGCLIAGCAMYDETIDSAVVLKLCSFRCYS